MCSHFGQRLWGKRRATTPRFRSHPAGFFLRMVKRSAVEVDGVKLSAYAAKLPKARRTGDDAVDQAKVEQHKAMMKMIALMQDHPQLVHNQVASMQAAIEALKQPRVLSQGDWHDTYTTIKQLPKYFCAIMLISRVGLGKMLVDRIDFADSEHGVRSCFQFVAALDPNDHLPKELRNKRDTDMVLGQRIEEVGRAASFRAAVSDTGVVDWAKLGCYRVLWEAEGGTQIEHQPTKSVKFMLSSYNFTREWRLENNWNDMRTRAYHPAGGELMLHTLWKGTHDGPYKHRVVKNVNCIKTLYDQWLLAGSKRDDGYVDLIVNGTEQSVLPWAAELRKERAKKLSQTKQLKKRNAHIQLSS